MTTTSLTLRQQLAQKLMIDIRRFDDKPVTQLPAELAHLIASSGLGGVILFAENCQSSSQIQQLTSQLQQAAAQSPAQLPLIISIDQEGGRVVRLPRSQASGFAGHMAIGATQAAHGHRFATLTGDVLGTELSALGINCNHGPTLDVNNNPANPVINVRAFGEDPKVVAQLGQAQLQAMQQQGVIATIKHFPGHGDTAVDSHTGLPRVVHPRCHLEQCELLPFKRLIATGQVEMVMTAHIQFPALDNSTLATDNGDLITAPATMSRLILTDLLRGELGFNGVVITDAMDMAGIAQYFSPTQAVINAFAAGVDIALMPLRVRTAEDLSLIDKLLDGLEAAVLQQLLDADEINASCQRIISLKQRFDLAKPVSPAQLSTVNQPQHQQWQAELAAAAITELGGSAPALPQQGSIAIVMPRLEQAQALANSLTPLLTDDVSFECAALLDMDEALVRWQQHSPQLLISGFIWPKPGPAELGGMEDIARLQQLADRYQPALLEPLFSALNSVPTIFVALRTPYGAQAFAPNAAWRLATFADHLDSKPGETAFGYSYQALAQVIAGHSKATGQSPVSLSAVNETEEQQ
ncbi:glycoside hydrolase family 3 protein [Ferrimonas senticii]|uniref:glycoside hydrolase family 3 protein n=1 Tax=Ferrimonas senticii TaxID=394566 RepID=UPI00040909BD|nr:glycoside hydrolase family 3 protein [Ferrimonas senticii]